MSRREVTASPFRDLSNLRGPNPNPNPASPLFFTASKTSLPTPTPLRRRGRPLAGVGSATPLDRRLRTLELDQSRFARRAESGRERALRAFAGTASSWLSLLLGDPSSCGCFPASAAAPSDSGKREAIDGARERGRSPKRQRGGERRKGTTPVMVAALRESLREVCSLEDVTERMGRYMSTVACEEVLVMMFKVCKNIDEGRLKMKAHCPLVTDLRLKERATKIFMSYSPEWLRIGLHIVLGGDSLLQNGLGKRDKEVPFLKLILEKQFFAFAHNKMVEGLHRLGYTEALGNVLLKRIFLLVAALDKAKMESALPAKCGIDGLDGGSSILFCRQSQIKSSQQIIHESLGEAIHGEGDLLMHLMTLGYKLNYQQFVLSEYDFTIGDLFEDLQDGIILCRVVQLLLSDASIILKVIAPSDTHRKRLHNGTMAIQYIKQAGVSLSDADGVTISAEDIANGDKELILSLLSNIFINLQLPLLADKTSLVGELTRLKAMEQPTFDTKLHIGLLHGWIQVICEKYGINAESSKIDRRALSCLINYYLNIDIHRCHLKESLSDCRKELFSCSEPNTLADITDCPSSNIGKVLGDFIQALPASDILATDAFFDERSAIVLLAFLYSNLANDKKVDQLRKSINQRLDYQSSGTKVSTRCRSQGNNDVRHPSPQREDRNSSCTREERAATIIQAQARRIIATNKYLKLKKATFVLQGAMQAWSAVVMRSKCNSLTVACSNLEQLHGYYSRHFILISERHRFVQMRKSALIIQQAFRAWIRERKRYVNNKPSESQDLSEAIAPTKTDGIVPAPEQLSNSENKTETSATPLQHFKEKNSLIAFVTPQRLSYNESVSAASTTPQWLCNSERLSVASATPMQLCDNPINSTVSAVHQLYNSGHDSVASTAPQQSCMFESSSIISATPCQLCKDEADCIASATQLVCKDEMGCFSHLSCQAQFQIEQAVSTQNRLFFSKEVMCAQKIQSAYKRFVHIKISRILAATKIQSHWRGFSVRMCFTKQVQAIIAIQAATRHVLCQRAFQKLRLAAVVIQQFIRGWLARKRLLGASLQSYTGLCALDQRKHERFHQSLELKIVVYSVLRLQRWWRKVVLHQSLITSAILIQSSIHGRMAQKQVNQIFCSIYLIQRWWRKVMFCESRKRAVLVIQAHIRGWIARQAAIRRRKRITIIQSYVKAYLVRKSSKQEVAELRSRLLKSSARVDDDMRLINRLLAAVSQLIHCRSISSIRQTCATLSIATKHSEKCCEKLVSAGAVDILLKQIHLLNRGIPDQEVSKQVLFTLRNIARFPSLRSVLVNTPQPVEIIFQELLRNKTDGFFIACDILKRMCESKEGLEIARVLQAHIRRLGNLVQDLEKKVELDKRNARTGVGKENNLRRFGEAVTLHHLITNE